LLKKAFVSKFKRRNERIILTCTKSNASEKPETRTLTAPAERLR